MKTLIASLLFLTVATACLAGNFERFIISDSQRQQVLADAGTNDALVVSIDTFPTDADKQDALTIIGSTNSASTVRRINLFTKGTNNVATVFIRPQKK